MKAESLALALVLCYNGAASGGRGAITRNGVKDPGCTGNCNADKGIFPEGSHCGPAARRHAGGGSGARRLTRQHIKTGGL